MSALATQFDVHLNQINQWKDQLPGGVTDVCDKKPNAFKEPKIDVKSMPGTTSSRGTMLVARGAEQSS